MHRRDGLNFLEEDIDASYIFELIFIVDSNQLAPRNDCASA